MGFIFYIVVLIFSVVIHEVSHGFIARRLGDPTAEAAGRLTLNPIKHLDPFGSVIFPLLSFVLSSPVMLAWAKPVPYNPNNLYKDYKYGPLKVALAGPASNLLLFLIFALLARFTFGMVSPMLTGVLMFVALINVSLAVFNLVPVPPLDGSKILPLLLPPQYARVVENVGLMGIAFVFLFVYFFAPVITDIVVTISTWVAGPLPVNYAFVLLQQIF